MKPLKYSSIHIFSQRSRPYGFSYGQWSERWWRWLLTIPKNENPVFDSFGTRAGINQSDPHVFFLCQTYSAVYPIPHRQVRIPKGRSLFLPIINWISFTESSAETDQDLFSAAKQRMDVIQDLEVIINGIEVKRLPQHYRAQSPFFNCVLPRENIIEVSPGSIRAISDGYWLFFKPQGQDVQVRLSSFGSCSSGATRIGVMYDLSIAES